MNIQTTDGTETSAVRFLWHQICSGLAKFRINQILRTLWELTRKTPEHHIATLSLLYCYVVAAVH